MVTDRARLHGVSSGFQGSHETLRTGHQSFMQLRELRESLFKKKKKHPFFFLCSKQASEEVCVAGTSETFWRCLNGTWLLHPDSRRVKVGSLGTSGSRGIELTGCCIAIAAADFLCLLFISTPCTPLPTLFSRVPAIKKEKKRPL